MTFPTVLVALALSWLSYRWAVNLNSAPLTIAATLMSLMALAALLGLDLSPPWGDMVLLVLGALVGIVAGSWRLASRGTGLVVGVGISLTTGAGLAGCFLDTRLAGTLGRWMSGLAWLYLIGWIPVLAADALRIYAGVWATFGLAVFLLLIATWTAAVPMTNQHKTPSRRSLQLFLLVLNVFLALTTILPSDT